MNVKDTAAAVQRELSDLGDTDIARHSKRFFKTGKGEYGEGDCFLGVRVPVLRRLSKQHRRLPLFEAEKLLTSQFHEGRLLAIFILIEHYKLAQTEEEREQIFKLCLKNIKHINNWDLVDSCAPHIFGAYLISKNKQLLFNLAGSNSLWERRIAIMSCLSFIRQHRFSIALKVSKILLHDKEDLIHKAVGWMLREIGNRDIKVEETFLNKYYSDMPRTTLRYAIEKFPQHKRRRYLAGHI
ncbi:MAG: DNA alkylation repair protein [Arenicellales bacterium]|nr:DNA alkylation repair protein [Arenicellales bacterium]